MTSPTWTKPHFWSTRVDAFGSGNVWARTRRTRGSRAARSSNARDAKTVAPWISRGRALQPREPLRRNLRAIRGAQLGDLRADVLERVRE
jgi:hypothetical protein